MAPRIGPTEVANMARASPLELRGCTENAHTGGGLPGCANHHG
jgi:hypothetical protein